MRHLILISLLLAACGSSKNPFGNGADGNTAGDGKMADGNGSGGSDGSTGPHKCVPAPKRVIIVGDSIVACSVIGGPDGPDCMSKQFSDYVIAHYGTGASYENHAVGGAVLDDIAGQLAGVPATMGPSLVLIYIGGNDLSPYIFQSDSAAMTAWTGTISPKLDSVYGATFATLADATKFPGGATLLMNTQYDPFDDCTAPPYNLSAAKIAILQMFNDKVTAIGNAAGDAAIVVDQHPMFLGHGHAYNVTTCPHYIPNATQYMQDVIHANAAGNAVLSMVADGGADGLYRDCTQ